MASPHVSSIPVFWGHGSNDQLVKYQFCQDSSDFLMTSLGIPPAPASGEFRGLSYNIYDGVGHSTNQKELDDLKAWIIRALPSEGSQ
jgi:Predicted esterase